jgi:hypothetical protein
MEDTLMNRLPKLMVALFVVALLVGVTMPILAAETSGKVKSISADKNEFVMADANQKNWTFQLGRDAKVLINDKEGKLADLQVDNEVAVTYEKQGDKLIVSQVKCTRK